MNNSKQETKELQSKTRIMKVLDNCSGYALPGQTLYIMGASGAGKTSLMNVLSDRILIKKGCKLEGSLTINDKYPIN